MDLGFFRRAQQGFADRSSAALDYRVLVATLQAMQSSSPAARAETGAAGAAASLEPANHPLVELLLGGPGWREAIPVQGGCFNPAAAQRRRNGL